MRFKTALLNNIIVIISFITLVSCSSSDKSVNIDNYNESVQQVEVLYNQNNDSALYFAEQAIRYATNGIELIVPLKYKALITAINGNVNTSIDLFNEALMLAEGEDQLELTNELLILIGEQYYNKGNYDKALEYFIKAQRISTKNNFQCLEALCLHYFGKYYHTIGDFNKSIEYYEHSYLLATQCNLTDLLISLSIKIGKHYETLGNYVKALENYIHAEKLMAGTTDLVLIATNYNHLGNIYHLMNDIDKAFEYHKNSLHIRETLGYPEGVAKSLKNLGELYESVDQPDSAIFCYRKSLELCEEIQYTKGKIKALTNLGRIYWNLQKSSDALELIKQSNELSNSVGYVKGIVRSGNELANIYIDLNKLTLAEKHLLNNIRIGTSEDLRIYLRTSYEMLYRLNILKLNYHKATQYVDALNELNYYFYNEERNKQLAQIQIKYQAEKKEQQNLILIKENEIKSLSIQKKNQLIILYSVISLLLVFGFILIYTRFIKKSRDNKELSELNEKIDSQNKKLKKLNKALNKSNYEKDKLFSIISHELRNPLYWSKNLVEILTKQLDSMNKSTLKKTLSALEESSKTTYHLMDNLLNWSKSQINRVTIQPQRHGVANLVNEVTRYFMGLTQQRRLTIINQVPESIIAYADPDSTRIIIRNLLSNAIKFTPEGGTIRILASTNNGYYKISVIDTGIGIEQAKMKKLFNQHESISSISLLKEKGNGLGLLLCKDLAERNKGKIWIEKSNEQGTEIVFILPSVFEYKNNCTRD